jgi:MerR family transcriptional regulator, heat shock protein HspR
MSRAELAKPAPTGPGPANSSHGSGGPAQHRGPAPTGTPLPPRAASGERPAVDPARGVYAISVAAELVGIDPQSLRLYERRGLLEPARSEGGTRRYSGNDIDRLHRICQLVQDGLNLAGIALVLDLEADNARLRARLADAHPR